MRVGDLPALFDVPDDPAIRVANLDAPPVARGIQVSDDPPVSVSDVVAGRGHPVHTIAHDAGGRRGSRGQEDGQDRENYESGHGLLVYSVSPPILAQRVTPCYDGQGLGIPML